MIHLGDCVEVMATLAENSVDAIVTDPPYGLEFMGKEWDRLYWGVANPEVDDRHTVGAFRKRSLPQSFGIDGTAMQRWHLRWATEALRVLKPGGHLLAFGGTRTYHRLVCALEDAGFEIRDTLAWIYASGFPKSLNLKGKWSGWGTALKPAHEPIVLARKPLSEPNVAANVLRWGTGAINVDGCRVGTEKRTPGYRNPQSRMETSSEWNKSSLGIRREVDTTQGRWPANLIHDGSDEVVGLFPVTTSGEGGQPQTAKRSMEGWGMSNGGSKIGHGDSGSAARFFYTAKASRAEREAQSKWFVGMKNVHPTLKPVSLMRYLCRLVTPPGGVILDPFLGSGSTAVAAILENFRWVGIEKDPDYVRIARVRVEETMPLMTRTVTE